MLIQIPWIGYNEAMVYHKRALNQSGFDVQISKDMNSGLALLQRKSYPVIIVQDWLSKGGLKLPPKIPTDDPTEMTCYFLTQIRAISYYAQTPILIPHSLSKEDKPERLIIDNSVELVDILHAESMSSGIVAAVKRHILNP